MCNRLSPKAWRRGDRPVMAAAWLHGGIGDIGAIGPLSDIDHETAGSGARWRSFSGAQRRWPRHPAIAATEPALARSEREPVVDDGRRLALPRHGETVVSRLRQK